MKWNNNHILRIKVFLRDKEKKSYLTIGKEVFVLWFSKKSFPLYYFGRFLYRKDVKNYKDFLNLKEYYSIIKSKKINNPDIAAILGNKLAFAFFCEKNNVPSPEILGYNLKNVFYHEGKKVFLDSVEQLKIHFDEILKQNNNGSMFIKTLSDSGGKGVFRITKEDVSISENLGEKIMANACIHQGSIKQHEDLNKMYPKSVNTIRIDTYIDNKNTPHVLSTTMRIGSGGNTVDNVSAGGFFVPIDLESGKLLRYTFQSMVHGGKKFTRHPDTDFEFFDFKIPYFEEAKNLCISLCEHIPNRLTGWDIAITPYGPIVIEGNPEPGILVGEYFHGGFSKHPLIKEMLAIS